MNESRRSFKTFVLVVPLLAMLLALHAWGDAAADRVGHQVDLWQYPEVPRPPFRLRLPRRVGDELVAGTLARFPEECVAAYGALLDLHRPTLSVDVLLLGSDGSSIRLAGEAGRNLKVNESLYDPERRAILVRMDQPIDQTQVTEALRRGIARLLLSDAGSARWSPWLAEGLVGILANSKAADVRPPLEELPPLELLLTSGESGFRGHDGAAYARAARLLVSYLFDAYPTEFAAYCRASRLEGSVRLSRFIERFGTNPIGEQAAWREWIQRPK